MFILCFKSVVSQLSKKNLEKLENQSLHEAFTPLTYHYALCCRYRQFSSKFYSSGVDAAANVKPYGTCESSGIAQ